MHSHWKVWTDATSELEALVTSEVVETMLGMRLENVEAAPGGRGSGYLVSFDLAVVMDTWPERVLEVLKLAQLLGRDWVLGGAIDEELSAMTQDPFIKGVSMVTCELFPEG